MPEPKWNGFPYLEAELHEAFPAGAVVDCEIVALAVGRDGRSVDGRSLGRHRTCVKIKRRFELDVELHRGQTIPDWPDHPFKNWILCRSPGVPSLRGRPTLCTPNPREKEQPFEPSSGAFRLAARPSGSRVADLTLATGSALVATEGELVRGECMMHAGAKVAVAGSTGRVGRNVVDVLRARGFEVVPMSRAEGVDLVTGKGLAEAVAGTSCIVHVASGPSPEQEQATEFFTASARNLQDAGQRAGVSHIVAVSIIGCDKFSAGYNVAKVAQERTLQAGPIPVRILRAAQFHEFVAQMVEWGTQGDVCYLPRMRTQLVAARNVAEELVDLATQPAAGTDSKPVPEIAGPRAENLADVAKLLVARRGGPTQVEEVSDPADPDRDLFASGALLPGPHATLAGPTFQQWLESTPDA